MFFFGDFTYRQCRDEKTVCPRRVILWLTFCKKRSGYQRFSIIGKVAARGQ
jgi:hypothetical protein